jgi:hypothetical protein
MRVPNPAYWLIESESTDMPHYRCIERAHADNLVMTSEKSRKNMETEMKVFKSLGFMKTLRGLVADKDQPDNLALATELAEFDKPSLWWGYNVVGKTEPGQGGAIRDRIFFPGMRVPVVATLLVDTPLLPETQIFHRFGKGDDNHNMSLISPFFFVGVRDEQAAGEKFVSTKSQWGMYGYVAWRMREAAKLLADCECVEPFPEKQPTMLTGFKIPKARWMYPHFKLDSDTLKVKPGHTTQTSEFVGVASIGRGFTDFLKLLSTKTTLHTTDQQIDQLAGRHDGFVYMEHLKELYINYIVINDDATRLAWLKDPVHRQLLRERALLVAPNERADVHTSQRYSSVEADVLAPAQADTDAEPELTDQSIETREEMDQLNAAAENRGSILEAQNELGKTHDATDIDDATGSLTETAIKESAKKSKPVKLRAEWENAASNTHFAVAARSPWSYSDIYEQADSKPEYETDSADPEAYKQKYGSDYNLYLDGPHPRLLKGFRVSYGKVKIFARA